MFAETGKYMIEHIGMTFLIALIAIILVDGVFKLIGNICDFVCDIIAHYTQKRYYKDIIEMVKLERELDKYYKRKI
jgi:hypothetical protein